jgi:hypothetical protein
MNSWTWRTPAYITFHNNEKLVVLGGGCSDMAFALISNGTDVGQSLDEFPQRKGGTGAPDPSWAQVLLRSAVKCC